MDDLEKGPSPGKHRRTIDITAETEPIIAAIEVAKDSPENEAAVSKLWAVYVSEAEKYDRGLVESWKGDMEGMLIFAGLFSASLTAFLIESYKTLNPDPENTTALLLAQISHQLAASANGTSFHIPPAAPFTPPTSSIVCNILWFISLGLSLTCALIATLLEQWARDFLHRADMRSAPVVRARVFSFTYYGLKRFKMHTVVEIIPLLLHTSLFLFFIGLVAFLLPVNIALTVVVGIILATVTTVYALLTLLPLTHLDCPYRTPLSRGFWSLRQSVETVLNRWRLRPSKAISQPPGETMVEGVFRKAMEPSSQRYRRDTQALVWTVKSLADDNELEPFLEAIPDALWRSDWSSAENMWGLDQPQEQRCYVYDNHMRRLIDSPDVQLLQRLRAFYNSCFSGLLNQQVRERRQICVYKAVWALCCLSAPGQPAVLASAVQLGDYSQVAPGASRYGHSAIAIQAWANMRAAQPLLDETLRSLTSWKIEMDSDNSKIPNVSLLAGRMSKLAAYHIHPPIGLKSWNSLRADIESSIQYIHALPFTIFIGYLSHAGRSNVSPYRFATTRSLIRPTTEIPLSAQLCAEVASALDMALITHKDLFHTDESLHWQDEVFRTILSYWKPLESEVLPWAVFEYINTRTSQQAISCFVHELSDSAWRAVPRSIGSESFPTVPTVSSHPPMDHLTRCLLALWRLCQERKGLLIAANYSYFEEIIHSIVQTDVRELLTSSVIAMAKHCFFGALDSATWRMDERTMVLSFNHRLLPVETSISTPATGELGDIDLEQLSRLVGYKCTEAKLATLSEFIECCVSGALPYKAVATVCSIDPYPIESDIHPAHQLRFASAIQALLNASVDPPEREALSQQILYLPVFSGYAPTDALDSSRHASTHAWLDNSEARNTLKTALNSYLPKFSSTGQNARLWSRVIEMTANLDTLHPRQAEATIPSLPE
ncbi:hypothetical protein DFH06DRAFT_1473220 [Mycena polygramma]|nr:hypothetical protein DFH06DRAFT_1473220 [Mycena polygramma]